MTDRSEIELEREDDIRVMTTEVVTAYLGSNQLAARDLPGLIQDVFNTLSGLGGSAEHDVEADSDTGNEAVAAIEVAPEPEAEEEPQPAVESVTAAESDQLTPAVPIESSVTDDVIYCLESGRGFKTLKRHLSSKYGMTPDEYRRKWGLPEDYPMVAPNYSKRRSETAKKIGLGRRPRNA